MLGRDSIFDKLIPRSASGISILSNAPDCDGQGICCFGCPTGAKRSTDVSYVPEALKRGAQLITAAHVTTLDVVAGRVRGATATLGGDPGAEGGAGRRPRLIVKAAAFIGIITASA